MSHGCFESQVLSRSRYHPSGHQTGEHPLRVQRPRCTSEADRLRPWPQIPTAPYCTCTCCTCIAPAYLKPSPFGANRTIGFSTKRMRMCLMITIMSWRTSPTQMQLAAKTVWCSFEAKVTVHEPLRYLRVLRHRLSFQTNRASEERNGHWGSRSSTSLNHSIRFNQIKSDSIRFSQIQWDGCTVHWIHHLSLHVKHFLEISVSSILF